MGEKNDILKDRIESGISIGTRFAKAIIQETNERIKVTRVITLMKSVFYEWDEKSLPELVTVAQSSGRHYGELDVLVKEYLILKERFKELNVAVNLPQAQRWLKLCLNPRAVKGIGNIIHFALCCFVKSPLEAIAECIGSRINQHGRKERTPGVLQGGNHSY